jgi:hypothetical protein
VTTRSAKAEFSGRWRLSWTRVWSKDALDLVEPAFIEFKRESGAELGSFAMIAMTGWLHCYYGLRYGHPAVEFTWQGSDEGDERCGRGWAVLEHDGKLRGHLFIHCGDDTEFVAEREPQNVRGSRRAATKRRPSVR